MHELANLPQDEQTDIRSITKGARACILRLEVGEEQNHLVEHQEQRQESAVQRPRQPCTVDSIERTPHNRHKQHKGQHLHNTEHIEHCNQLLR